jgi:type IV fimbrial biogenesis protein FimT
LQNGLRQAQAEAVRRSRIVVVEFRDAGGNASTADAVRWSIATVPLAVNATTTLGASELVRTGRISESAGVLVNGTVGAAAAPTRLCFNSMGMLVGYTAIASITVATDPAGAYAAGAAVCPAPAANSSLQFNVRHPSADRPLNVLVSNSGRVRMCDPGRNIATAPDGCP